MVSIDRNGKAKTMRKMISDVKKKLDEGSTIIIFPEGTRKKPREKANYKSGLLAYTMQQKENCNQLLLTLDYIGLRGLVL